MQRVYLTIDDAPSPLMQEKANLLLGKNIPAVFYCRGEDIKKHLDAVVYSIQKGFLIGNHSYSHPYFSKLSLTQCYDEITKTEALIEQAYSQAKITRPAKIIRLPFGDRGDGKTCSINASSNSTNALEIQKFLKKQGFKKAVLEGTSDEKDNHIDSGWTADTRDYKSKHLENLNTELNLLKEHLKKGHNEIILLHDFSRSHSAFKPTIETIIASKAHLSLPSFR